LVRPTVGCGSAMFARAVLIAIALPAGCGRVFGELRGSGTRNVGGSAFAAIRVDFAISLARRAPWRARADDDFLVFHALADLVSIAAELIVNVANSFGGPAVRSRLRTPRYQRMIQ
jgi:hypothetical protein